MSMSKRQGKFLISEERLMQASKTLYEIFGNTIIWKADYEPFKKGFTYYATSPLFKEVKEGEETPLYEFFVDKEGNLKAKTFWR